MSSDCFRTGMCNGRVGQYLWIKVPELEEIRKSMFYAFCDSSVKTTTRTSVLWAAYFSIIDFCITCKWWGAVPPLWLRPAQLPGLVQGGRRRLPGRQSRPGVVAGRRPRETGTSYDLVLPFQKTGMSYDLLTSYICNKNTHIELATLEGWKACAENTSLD